MSNQSIFQEHGYDDRADFIECLAKRFNYKLEVDRITQVALLYSDEDCVNGELEEVVKNFIDMDSFFDEFRQQIDSGRKQ